MLNTQNIKVIEHGDFAATMRGKLDALTEEPSKPELSTEEWLSGLVPAKKDEVSIGDRYDWSCGMGSEEAFQRRLLKACFVEDMRREHKEAPSPMMPPRMARVINKRWRNYWDELVEAPKPSPATPTQVAALQSGDEVISKEEVALTQADAFKVFEQTEPASEKAAINWLVLDGFDEVDAKTHWAAWRESKPKKVSRITRRDEKSIRDSRLPDSIANLEKGLADGTIEVIPNAYEKPEPKPRDNEDVMAEALEAKYPIKPETIDGLVEAIEYAVKHSNKPEALTLTDGFYAVEVDDTLRIKHPALPDINRTIGVKLVSGIYGRAIQRGEVRSLLLRLKEANAKKGEARQGAARSVTAAVTENVTGATGVTPAIRDTVTVKSKPTGKSEVVYNDKVYSL